MTNEPKPVTAEEILDEIMGFSSAHPLTGTQQHFVLLAMEKHLAVHSTLHTASVLKSVMERLPDASWLEVSYKEKVAALLAGEIEKLEG